MCEILMCNNKCVITNIFSLSKDKRKTYSRYSVAIRCGGSFNILMEIIKSASIVLKLIFISFLSTLDEKGTKQTPTICEMKSSIRISLSE